MIMIMIVMSNPDEKEKKFKRLYFRGFLSYQFFN